MLFVDSVAAQVGWQPVRVPERMDYPLLAWDTVRERTVVYDSLARRMWETDGVTWVERTPAVVPPERSRSAMVFDEARRRLLLFGGAALAPSNETWEWDGSTWLQRTPAVSPAGRWGHAMAYDAARQRVVMFGGTATFGGGAMTVDTWEWDGTTWLQRTPSSTPPGRLSHAMTYDSVRQRVVMCGGEWPTVSLADTWEWDGSNWLAGPAGPGRSRHAIAYDPLRQRTVLFGGGAFQLFPPLGYAFVPSAETWEWDGATWMLATSATAPTVTDHAMGFDGNRQRVISLGGSVGADEPLLLWEWDGIDWSSEELGPSAAQRMAFDSIRGRTVMQVRDQTWQWDGAAWHRAATSATPHLANHGTAFDVARQRVVVFGGSTGIGFPTLGETWTWDGSVWTQHAVPGPSSRVVPAMAYDPVRQRTVVFGGLNSSGSLLGDTWEWDGQSWTQVVGSPSPSPQARSAMAWDGVLQRLIMFGGLGLLGTVNNAWSWNGSVWTQLSTPTSLALGPFELAHDAGRNRVVLLSMVNVSPLVNRPMSWDWDGATWTQRTGPLRVEPIAGDVLGRVISMTSVLTAAPRAAANDSGTPCAGIGAAPRLSSSDPYLGNRAFALEVLDAPANAPCIFGLAFFTASMPLGAGCTLLIDTPFVHAVGAANASGVARTSTVTIPVIAALSGATLHAQALAFDPLAALGFTLSARRTLTFGP